VEPNDDDKTMFNTPNDAHMRAYERRFGHFGFTEDEILWAKATSR